MLCKNCEYYEPYEIEDIVNRSLQPPRWEVVRLAKYGTCNEVVIDACDMSSNEMENQSAKILTWDGSSYMSGAYISEDFGCIKFKRRL